MDNMRIYEAAKEVPLEAQKEFDNGRFKGTDINPMWRIKKLTELFGPAGIGWYYKILSERCEEHADVTMSIVDLELYIKVDGEWSMPIYGTGGNQLVKATRSGQQASDEGYKMALTDALSVACKALGIGADIYFAKDKTKYTASGDAEPAPDTKPHRSKTATTNAQPTNSAPICKRCAQNGITTQITGYNGLTPQEVAESRKKQTGMVLCDTCMLAWQAYKSRKDQENEEGVAE